MAEPRHIGYFDPAVIEPEFRQKFNNCFVQLKTDYYPLQFWHIESNADASEVNFSNAHEEVINIESGYITSNLEIQVVFPEEGWYIHKDRKIPILITRHPSKQWRRAPNKDNMFVRAMTTEGLTHFGLTIESLNSTLDPLNEVPRHQIIARKFLLRRYRDTDWSILWYFDAEIGFYNHTEDKYYMTHHWYRLPSYVSNRVVYCKYFSLKV